MTDERETRLGRAMRAMDENTRPRAIDRALAHYLADKRAKAAIADDLTNEHVKALSTPYLQIECETTVRE
jgi:hypothetical protein